MSVSFLHYTPHPSPPAKGCLGTPLIMTMIIVMMLMILMIHVIMMMVMMIMMVAIPMIVVIADKRNDNQYNELDDCNSNIENHT